MKLGASLPRVPVERELRHHEHRPADVREREVHLVLGVREQAQSHDLLRHPRDLLIAVGGR
jgi:hypothetical protein